MIDIPTTDISTPIKGEAGKAATKEHSETTEVSFLSVISAENANTDALAVAPDQPAINAVLPHPNPENANLAVTFATFVSPIASVPVPTQQSLTAIEMPNEKASGPIVLASQAMGGPPQKEGSSGPALSTAPAIIEIADLGEATVDKDAGKVTGNSVFLVPQNGPGTASYPEMASTKASALPQGKLPVAYQFQNLVLGQRSQIGSKNAVTQNPYDIAPAPTLAQPPAQTATQVPMIGSSVPTEDAKTPSVEVGVDGQRKAQKSNGVHPELARAFGHTPPQNAPQPYQPEATAKSQAPVRDVQPLSRGPQTEVKPPIQGAETAAVQPFQPATAQTLTNGGLPQATLSPTVEKYIARRTDQPSEVPPTKVTSSSASAASNAATTVAPPTATIEAVPTEARDLISTPEILPFDPKSADTISNLRHDGTLNRPEVMRHVAQQLTAAARQMPDRPVELALNPEELGRVRLTFTATDGGIHIAVMAERGDTMELMRRHIETLAQEFRELGYKDVNFEFSHDGQKTAQDADADAKNGTDKESTTSQTNEQTLAPVQLSLEPSVGLDLRL